MFVTHDMNVVAIFWIAVVFIVFVTSFFRYRERASRHRMIETLAASKEEIRQHQELLEDRIRQRTGELERAMHSALAASQASGVAAPVLTRSCTTRKIPSMPRTSPPHCRGITGSPSRRLATVDVSSGCSPTIKAERPAGIPCLIAI